MISKTEAFKYIYFLFFYNYLEDNIRVQVYNYINGI